jgi:hypothetical protein
MFVLFHAHNCLYQSYSISFIQLAYIFNYVKSHHVWNNGYGSANSAEYWAEATSSYFITVTRHGHGSPAVGMNE